jgi:hypothetical protein
MNSKEDLSNESGKINAHPDANQSPAGQKQLLYFDHARIRHMERIFDLFITLFKRR